jgi:hypothetical protein
MSNITLDYLTERLHLADQLRLGRKDMLHPQDLPGSYGRVIKAIDHVLTVSNGQAVLAGGWAVWRHGYIGRVTQDVDIALAKEQVDEFMRVAGIAGFELLPTAPGRWPKLRHKDTNVEVDIMPEGGRPGTESHPAPTTIPHPTELGAEGNELRYIRLPALIELKLAAGRARDVSDIVELIRVNPDQLQTIRDHLTGVHAQYLEEFDRLVERARDEE